MISYKEFAKNLFGNEGTKQGILVDSKGLSPEM